MTTGKDEIVEKIQNLQIEYGECKIDTATFTKKLNELGIYTAEEVDFQLALAEDCRFEHKMDKAAEKYKQDTLDETVVAMPFPEKDAG